MTAYAHALTSRAWRETRTLFFQKALKVFIRDLVLFAGGLAAMYVFQDPLVRAGVLPQSSNLAVNKALPAPITVGVFLAAYAATFVAELLVFSPFRLWNDREPLPEADALAMVDEETMQIAGVVAALRDRVLIWGFKTPVSFEDPYFGLMATVENSTHPIWIDDAPRSARIDFVQGCKTLPYLNREHGDRAEIEHWRALVKDSADTLIRLLRGPA